MSTRQILNSEEFANTEKAHHQIGLLIEEKKGHVDATKEQMEKRIVELQKLQEERETYRKQLQEYVNRQPNNVSQPPATGQPVAEFVKNVPHTPGEAISRLAKYGPGAQIPSGVDGTVLRDGTFAPEGQPLIMGECAPEPPYVNDPVWKLLRDRLREIEKDNRSVGERNVELGKMIEEGKNLVLLREGEAQKIIQQLAVIENSYVPEFHESETKTRFEIETNDGRKYIVNAGGMTLEGSAVTLYRNSSLSEAVAFYANVRSCRQM